jgi:hypothetical protein
MVARTWQIAKNQPATAAYGVETVVFPLQLR